MLRIYTLGHFEVRRGRHRIREEEWRTEVNKTLLKAFLTEPEKTFSTDELIERLWPDASTAAARRVSLRARVSELRRLGIPLETIRSVGYRLNLSRLQLDFRELERLSDQAQRAEAEGDLERAVELLRRAVTFYRGDFLPDDLHREWTQPTRERLRALYLRALQRLIRLLEALRKDDEAVEWIEQALLISTYDESLYRRLMRIHRRRNRPAEALRVYERCVQALRQLDVEPAEETKQLAEMIREETSEGKALASASASVRVRHPEEAVRLREHLQSIFRCVYQDPDRAIRDAQGVQARFRELGSALGEAEALHVVASAEMAQTRLQAAEQALNEAEACLAYYDQARRMGSVVEETDVERAADWAELVRIKVESARGQLLSQRERFEEALALYDRALQRAKAWGFFRAEVSLLLSLGVLHYRQGRVGEAGLHWEQARRRARRLGLPSLEAKASNNLALVREQIGDLEGARDLYERAIELLEPLEDLQGLADAWNNLGALEDILGRWDRAEEAYARAQELGERMGDPLGVAIEEMNRGGIAIQRRRYREARERLEKALSQFERLKCPSWGAEALRRLAWLYWEQGKPAQALVYAEEGLQQIEGTSVPGQLEAPLWAYGALSLTALGPERRVEALEWAQRAERIVEEEAVTAPETAGYRWIQVRYRLWQAFQQLGEEEKAIPHLERAYDALQAIEGRLRDPEHKKSFPQVRMHREIRKAWEESRRVRQKKSA